MPDFGFKMAALSEFEKSVEGKRFRHPSTSNMVLFKSLPVAEQHRIYEEWQQKAQEQPSTEAPAASPAEPPRRVKKLSEIKKHDRLSIVDPKGERRDFIVIALPSQFHSDIFIESVSPGSIVNFATDALDYTHKSGVRMLRPKALKKLEVYVLPAKEKSEKPEVPKGKSKSEVPKPDHWKSVKMEDIYEDDFVVYEHDGERHMGLVVSVEGPKKGAATKFWVTPVDPTTGKPINPSQRHSFDAEKIKARDAVIVPPVESPKLAPKFKPLTPEEKAKLEKERKEKEEKERKEREEAEKKRKAAVEEMGKTGKPIEKLSDIKEDDVISFHWKGDVYHGRVIEAKGSEFFILPIDPKTGRITSTKYDTFRSHDIRDTDAHKVEAEHAPKDPRKENILEVFKSLTRLEEDPKLYFHHPPDSQLIPMSKIRPSKVRLKGVINGNELLEQAAKGKWGKRAPISLIDNEDGTYTVRDGNSTYTNARLSQWEEIPAVIKTQAEWEEHARKEKERKEKEEEERKKNPPSTSLFGPLWGPAGHPSTAPTWAPMPTPKGKAPQEKPEAFKGKPVESMEELKGGDLFGYKGADGRWYVGRVLQRKKGQVLYEPLHPTTGRSLPGGSRLFREGPAFDKVEPIHLEDYEFPEGGKPRSKKAALDDLRSIIADLRTAYRPLWQHTPGYKTLVDPKSEKGIFPADTESTDPGRGQSNLDSAWPVQTPQPREKERALPLPSNHDRQRDKHVGPTYYNKNRRTPPRTRAVPGEEYGHPTKYDYNYVRRRDGVTALEEDDDEDMLERVALLPLPKPNQREKNLGPAYARVLHQWYLRNRSRKKLRQKLKYRTKLKRDPQAKKYRRYYRMYPARYKRRGKSPFGTPAERSKAWRDKQDQKSRATGKTPAELKELRDRKPSRMTRTRSPAAPGKRVYADERERFAEVLEMLAADWPINWNTQVKKTEPPESLDQNHAPSNPRSTVPRTDPQKQEGESLRAPNLPAKPQKGLQWKVEPPAPGGTAPFTTVNNPTGGSGKVIPMSWYTQEVNNTQALPDSRQDRYLRNNNEVKVAKTLNEVLSRCDKKIKERSLKYTPKLERTDTKNWIWHWRVGDHVVRVQAFQRGAATNFPKLNLRVSCSCPFWRWWGPAHWATKADYQKGQAPGTASYPEIRDPTHWRPICKHAYAVLQKSKNFFVRPTKSPLQKLGARFSPDSSAPIEIVTDPEDMAARVALASQRRESIRRVARRYLGEEES